MRTLFNVDDCGCIADASFGHEHVRETLAMWVSSLGTEEAQELATELRAPMSDDASEEDDAVELLSAACVPGLLFGFHEGDLMLQTEQWWEMQS